MDNKRHKSGESSTSLSWLLVIIVMLMDVDYMIWIKMLLFVWIENPRELLEVPSTGMSDLVMINNRGSSHLKMHATGVSPSKVQEVLCMLEEVVWRGLRIFLYIFSLKV